jgi:HK97 family phage major capsid protein
MARKLSEVVAEEMELLRAEIKVISEKEDATDEEIARGDQLLEEFKIKEVARAKHLDREAAVEEVLRANLAVNNGAPEGGNRESGATQRRGPEVIRKKDPFEGDAEMKEILRSITRGPEVVNFDADAVIERARYAVDMVPRWVSDKSKERLHAILDQDWDKQTPLIARHILATGSPEYKRQFHEYVQAMGQYVPELVRTAMSLTAGNGGVLVPHYLDPTIILTNAGVYAGTIRAISTVKTIATKTWEGVTSAGVTAKFTAEAVATTDASPSFGAPTITPAKADAWITGSYEIFEDSGFSSELGGLLADAKARLEETAFATSTTVTGFPTGVVAEVAAVTASIVTSLTTAAFAVGDVHNVSNAVNPRQEENLAWLAHKAIYSKIRQFDTSGGGGFWANLGVGKPALLLGAPALKSSAMTSVISTGTNILLAGDFSQFYIVDRIGMSVIYDPLVKTTASGAAPTGQAGWYAHWRVGSRVVNADAFRLLQLNQVADDVPLT